MTVINLVNTSGGRLAVDAKLGFKKAIKLVLATDEAVNIGDRATLDELNQSPELLTLLNQNRIRFDVAAEAGDVFAEGGVPTALGIGVTHKVITDLVDLLVAAADDVTVVATMPWPAQIVNVELVVETGVATETVTLRDTVAGAGNALSSALDGGTDNTRDVDVTTAPLPSVSRGGLLTARRTDDGVVGQLVVELMRTA